MKRQAAVYVPRHAPKQREWQPAQLSEVLAETAAFSLLVAQTKRGNGTAVYLLGELFGSDPLDTGCAA